MNKIIRYWFLILIIGLAFSCDKERVFEDTSSFKNGYWLADSIKSFDFVIDNPNDEYNLYLSIRNGREYPHSNMYINYTIRDSTTAILDEELRNFQLFHQKTGYPLGNGSGSVYEHVFEILIGYHFPDSGRYTLNLEQYMRYDSLPEVYSVGVRVEHKVD